MMIFLFLFLVIKYVYVIILNQLINPYFRLVSLWSKLFLLFLYFKFKCKTMHVTSLTHKLLKMKSKNNILLMDNLIFKSGHDL